MTLNKKVTTKLNKFLYSDWSFRLALLLYFLNSTWIAITALYPMAFDEQYHLGLIKLYSGRLLPFWSSNPPGEAVYGAVARDPSYLYHYLLSFPYQVIETVIPSEFAQILILRFTSILIFGFGIYIFRKVLLQAGFSKAITNSSLLIFVLLPIVPLLAAHINYDGLIFTLSALVLWQTQKFAKTITKDKQFDVKRFAVITLLCMFGSLVKYAFLPFVLGVVIYLGILVYGYVRSNRQVPKRLLSSAKSIGLRSGLVLLSLFILLFVLFFERYAINTIKYSNPTPACDQVLSVDQCLAFGPWRRNYYTRQAKQENRLEKVYSTNPIRYFVTLWLSETTYQLFFAIDGPKFDYRVGQPFRILRNSSVIILSLGIILIIYHNRYLRRTYYLKLFGLAIACYAGSLLALNYTEFLSIGYPFAIQGRYLVPILPLVIGLMVAAYSKTIGQKPQIKAYVFLGTFLVLVTQGGGAGTYILRSSYTWYWSGETRSYINYRIKDGLKVINFERNIQPVEKKIDD
jgi:hypothetical protein